MASKNQGAAYDADAAAQPFLAVHERLAARAHLRQDPARALFKVQLSGRRMIFSREVQEPHPMSGQLLRITFALCT